VPQQAINVANHYAVKIGDVFSLEKYAINNDNIWAVSIDRETYKDFFLEKDFNRNSFNEIPNMVSFKNCFGAPYLADGPVDDNGTIIQKWRLIHLKSDGSVEAVELTMVLNPPNYESTPSYIIINWAAGMTTTHK
jgi:hypothetical protein